MGLATSNMDHKTLTASINKFSAAFTKKVDSEQSSVSSPLSAELVLALVALGARGDTHQEILTALGIPDDSAIRSGLRTVAQNLKEVKGVNFKVANKVYVKEGKYELNKSFRDDAVQVFNAEVQKIVFDDGKAAAQTINTWVENQTNNKIKDLIGSDSLGPDTRLVLVNALYFKGSWRYKFPVEATRDRPFHVTPTKDINVPFMHIKKNFNYGVNADLDAQLLEMFYEGNEASLLIVLPNKVDGLSGVLEKLASGTVDLNDAAKRMFSTEVDVSLPKFKIETEIDLKDLLVKLGVKTIFDPSKADLTGVLDPVESLYVSKAVQKAFIEVNEEGAEAAAATDVQIALFSAFVPEDPPLNFEADRPFLAALRIRETVAFAATIRENFTYA